MPRQRRNWSKGISHFTLRCKLFRESAPLEDEDISVEVRLPFDMEGIYAARDQIHELVIQLQEQMTYSFSALAVPA